MNKKILLSVILFTAFVFSINYVFAANNIAQDAANMTQDATNAVTDSINKTGNTMQNAGNAVMDAANNVIDGTAGAINTMTEDRNTNTTPDNNNNMSTGNNNGNYSTTRTSAEGTLLGMNATTWTWIIMGLVAIAIIALVWYYSMQTTDSHYED